MDQKDAVMEQWTDAAACEAIGANTAADSAAYRDELAAAPPAGRMLDRELRETVAMISAASPYMEPPVELRGKVLQASAPANFRMEDYRKANREVGRFYRWGFYVAMLCLMAGAWFNMSMKSALTRTQNNLAAANHQVEERNVALRAFINPHVDQITFRENGKDIGKAFVDQEAKTAVVLLPEGTVPAGKAPQLSMPVDGKQVVYKTVLLTAPANMFDAKTGKSVDQLLAVKNTEPDPRRPQIAGK